MSQAGVVTVPPAREPPAAAPAWAVLRVPPFRRLWITQVGAGIGDWLGMLAMIEFAARVTSPPEVGISVVMATRTATGLLLAPVAGVIADRFDRRRTMIACHAGRAALLAVVPFSDSVLALALVSFGLEVAATVWTPAKEAMVPNLVAPAALPGANALSLAAGYGTFPLGALGFAALAPAGAALADRMPGRLPPIGPEGLALWVDGLLFAAAAWWLRRLPVPPARPAPARPGTPAATDRRRGMRPGSLPPRVRATFLGLAGGLLAGGSLVSLGPVYVREVMGAGEGAFGLLMAALGFGLAAVVVAWVLTPLRIPLQRGFVAALWLAAGSTAAAASVTALLPALAAAAVLGVGAGALYVTSVSMVQEEVPDEIRGRTFGAMYAAVRVALLVALAAWPLLSAGLDALSRERFGGALRLDGWEVALPGVRSALWLAAAVMASAAVLARRAFRRAPQRGAG